MAIASTGPSEGREGYVLIMTLVLIAVAALSVAGLARRSLLLATESIEAQQALQRRWGASSCRRLLLERAAEIFATLEAPHATGKLLWPAPSRVATQVTLAGSTYRLWLADEDAKLNLNQLRARLPQQEQELLTQLVATAVPLQLRPETSNPARLQKRWFSSWGQVVDLRHAWNLGDLEPVIATTTSLTCWGSRQLNLRRVSDDLLRLVASQAVTPEVGRKLLTARREATRLAWAELVKPLALNRKDEQALKLWFSDQSTCYSLWLELEEGPRRWYYQWVLGDRGSSAQEPVVSFQW